MTPFLILFVITLVNSEGTANETKCDGFQANFNLKDVIGEWQVVAIIPEKLFPEKQVTCYKVEISETDGVSFLFLFCFKISCQDITFLYTVAIITFIFSWNQS